MDEKEDVVYIMRPTQQNSGNWIFFLIIILVIVFAVIYVLNSLNPLNWFWFIGFVPMATLQRSKITNVGKEVL